MHAELHKRNTITTGRLHKPTPTISFEQNTTKAKHHKKEARKLFAHGPLNDSFCFRKHQAIADATKFPACYSLSEFPIANFEGEATNSSWDALVAKR